MWQYISTYHRCCCVLVWRKDAYIELGFKDAGYHGFHLDDCWAGGRDSSGSGVCCFVPA